MKTSELKKLIKDSVKEAMDDVIKDILLEAVKSNKTQIVENQSSHQIPQVNLSSTPPPKSQIDIRNSYMDVLNETSMKYTSKDVSQPFIPTSNVDPINGALPEGELGMDQIMSLMNTK